MSGTLASSFGSSKNPSGIASVLSDSFLYRVKNNMKHRYFREHNNAIVLKTIQLNCSGVHNEKEYIYTGVSGYILLTSGIIIHSSMLNNCQVCLKIALTHLMKF